MSKDSSNDAADSASGLPYQVIARDLVDALDGFERYLGEGVRVVSSDEALARVMRAQLADHGVPVGQGETMIMAVSDEEDKIEVTARYRYLLMTKIYDRHETSPRKNDPVRIVALPPSAILDPMASPVTSSGMVREVATGHDATPIRETALLAFDYDSPVLTDENRQILQRLVRRHGDAARFEITAYSHGKTGYAGGNEVLSTDRAEAVWQALMDVGMPARQIEVVISSSAHGQSELPVARGAVVSVR